MSYVGKLLAFTNILSFALLLVLSLMVYTKHKEWKYANYRYQTAIDGLPLHKLQMDARGQLLYENVDPGMQKDLFATNPVTTQKEEVERVQKALQAKLNGETNKAKQTALAAEFLLPLSQTNTQRERLIAVKHHLADDKDAEQLKKDLDTAYQGALADQKADAAKKVEWAFADRLNVLGGEPRGPFEEKYLDIMKKTPDKKADDAFNEAVDAINADLKEQLDREFKQVVEGQYILADDKGAYTIKKPMDDAERKSATSDLLFNLVESEVGADKVDRQAAIFDKSKNPSYVRYLNVVGLEAANRTMSNQTVRLSRILSELSFEQSRDRAAFVITLQSILDQSRDVARSVERLAADLQREGQKVRDQEVLVTKRQKDVEAAKTELADYRKTTADKLAKLREMSDAVFELRVSVRDKTVSNQDNERKIRELEGWRWLPFVGGKFLVNRGEP